MQGAQLRSVSLISKLALFFGRTIFPWVPAEKKVPFCWAAFFLRGALQQVRVQRQLGTKIAVGRTLGFDATGFIFLGRSVEQRIEDKRARTNVPSPPKSALGAFCSELRYLGEDDVSADDPRAAAGRRDGLGDLAQAPVFRAAIPGRGSLREADGGLRVGLDRGGQGHEKLRSSHP